MLETQAMIEGSAGAKEPGSGPSPDGHVTGLYRYPIKGLSPQAEASLDMVVGEGLPSDRRFALALGSTSFDPAAPAPLDKGFFLMLRRDERLAALKTRYDADSGRLSIVTPGGGLFEADLGSAAGRSETERFFHDYVGEACEGRPRLVEAEGHKFTDISVISPEMMRAISLINVASVRDLAARYGRPLDPLRFRANIHLDGVEAWDELGWTGRELSIGSVRFRGVLRTRRCAAVDVNPTTGARDTHLPKALVQKLRPSRLRHLSRGARERNGRGRRCGTSALLRPPRRNATRLEARPRITSEIQRFATRPPAASRRPRACPAPSLCRRGVSLRSGIPPCRRPGA